MVTIHLVSHTHWDREWYRTFEQFRLRLIHLIDRLLDIFENDPDFKYFLLDGQAIILEDYLQIRPERKADLLRFIQNGRLLIGPWYISPDEFLVSPESHIRNLLEGNRLCQLFGSKMAVGYLPDTFGHIGQMPQVLQGFNINLACFWRGLDDQPAELNWQSPDGSNVLLSYLRDTYGNAASLPTTNPQRFYSQIQDRCRSLAPHIKTGQILLMNGMDHLEPSQELSSAIRTFQEKYHQDQLVHSSLLRYFEAVRSQIASSGYELPVVTGELRSSKHAPLLQNVLSTRMWIKQRNHKCETSLLKWVEPLSAWSRLLEPSPSYPEPNHKNNNQAYLRDQKSVIQFAWKLLMKCHPHDSICGTIIDQVAKDMQVRFDQVDQISQELIEQNLQKISEQINTNFNAQANQSMIGQEIISSIIVFNPNDTPLSGLVSLSVMLDNQFSSIELIDEQHAGLPFHQSGTGSSELISMTMDKKALKQGLVMVDEGRVVDMVIRDFNILTEENKAFIRVTISDHGLVDLAKWKQGLAKLDSVFANENINEFVINAYSDPEVELSFVAADIPAHGYRCYWLLGTIASESRVQQPRKFHPLLRVFLPVINLAAHLPFLRILVGGKKPKPVNRSPQIENEYFLVEATAADGTLSIVDKRTNQVFQGLNRLIDDGDCGDLYNYCPPLQDRHIHPRMTSVEREETEITRKLIIHTELRLPKCLNIDRKSRSRSRIVHKLVSIITLVTGVPRIDIHTEIDNQAMDHRLRVYFPATFSCSKAIHDGHFELVERPIGLPVYDKTWEEPPRPEVPQRQFTLITDGQSSLTIANRGLPEVEVMKNKTGRAEIALTLLRCVEWLSRDDMATRKGHAGPMGITTPGAQMFGRQEFDYSIIPGDQNILPSIHQAYAFNAPLIAINASVHTGSLPPKHSFIESSNPNFLITAIKPAENSSDFIVRGFNILDSTIEVTLKPFRSFKHARLVNLLEETIEPLSINPSGRLILHIGPKKIVTILFGD